jgi:hypothetical protein
MFTDFRPTPPGCPWQQCGHNDNAHAKDHCLACDCEKPPPPMPTPVTSGKLMTSDGTVVAQTEEVELEALEMDVCNVCSAYVADRDKHVSWHERTIDTITNLVMSIGAVERRTYTDEVTRRAESANRKDTE